MTAIQIGACQTSGFGARRDAGTACTPECIPRERSFSEGSRIDLSRSGHRLVGGELRLARGSPDLIRAGLLGDGARFAFLPDVLELIVGQVLDPDE